MSRTKAARQAAMGATLAAKTTVATLLPEPSCESCGDTGRVVVWLPTWHGYEEGEIPCRKCTRSEA